MSCCSGPVIKSGNLERSVQFYTRILDFERKWPGYEDREMANGVVDLIHFDGSQFRRDIGWRALKKHG